ncbi:hypothetical protein AKJ56_01925 [candidate division MSBL1 archaeon SCGC-AAA382N08]|uniref:Uncharacterized protein n=1 Tax=candidate division MSBL1 archaeon SCGC-AAA382N08 TaxID=1698285 RepID=A0A133VNT2_9EURY|nr:hypothetical protein AKJ56_01925 [candidate division MSBL1 archaeon SCGC-AAA382N08]
MEEAEAFAEYVDVQISKDLAGEMEEEAKERQGERTDLNEDDEHCGNISTKSEDEEENKSRTKPSCSLSRKSQRNYSRCHSK